MYDWESLARTWSRQQPQRLWRRHSDSVYAELIERWIPRSAGSVLKTDAFDEAFSTGVYPVLQARARAIVAIDVSATVLEQAHGRHPGLRCVCADVRSLPFPSGSIDTIVSFSTLDHFDVQADLETGLSELARVLRPGGTLLLTLDNLASPVIALRRMLPFGLLHALRIVPYYIGWTCGPRRLQRMLEGAGLDVHRMDAIVHCPRLLAVALAALLDRCGSDRSREWFLRVLHESERLGALPTRFLTGHFVAVLARKPRVIVAEHPPRDRIDAPLPVMHPNGLSAIDKAYAVPSVGSPRLKKRVR